jgi:hypothetical protein
MFGFNGEYSPQIEFPVWVLLKENRKIFPFNSDSFLKDVVKVSATLEAGLTNKLWWDWFREIILSNESAMSSRQEEVRAELYVRKPNYVRSRLPVFPECAKEIISEYWLEYQAFYLEKKEIGLRLTSEYVKSLYEPTTEEMVYLTA